MIKDIKLYGDTILTRPCHKVTEYNEELEEFVLDMIETLRHHKALGLSAPQVGLSKQILIINQLENLPLIFINPTIIEHTMDMEIEKEACLSLPGITCDIPRFKEITVLFNDLEGAIQTAVLVDEEARIFQHELDHLNGKLMTFHLTPVRLGLIQGQLKRISKYRKFMDKYGNIVNQIAAHSHDSESGIHEIGEVSDSMVQSGQKPEMGSSQ